MAERDSGMPEVRVDASATHGGEVRFSGRQIAQEGMIVAHLTAKKKIAIVNHKNHSLYVYDTLDELRRDSDWRWAYPELFTAIEKELSVTDLDI